MIDSARQIEELIFTYADRIDGGDFNGLADLFAHGRIWGMEDPPPEGVFEGREGVLAMYRSSTRLYEDTGTPKTKHMTSNVRVSVADDDMTARATAYYSVSQATDELPLQIIITGHYADSFHRVDGEWCFDTRIMFVDQMGDLSHHLNWEI